jgi:hypothetical protein
MVKLFDITMTRDYNRNVCSIDSCFELLGAHSILWIDVLSAYLLALCC